MGIEGSLRISDRAPRAESIGSTAALQMIRVPAGVVPCHGCNLPSIRSADLVIFNDHMARRVTAHEAKARILAPLDEVGSGGEVEITKRGRVVARLVPARGPRALCGALQGVAVSDVASEAIESAEVLAVAPISWFELAWLAANGRIVIAVPLRSRLDRLAEHLVTVPIDPAIAAAAIALPSSFPGDPADRIIYATAIERGLRLATKDGRLRAHARPRLVAVW